MQELQNFKEEKHSACLYRKLAQIETNPVHQKLFKELAEIAEQQALHWEKKLKEKNITPSHKITLNVRARLVIFLVKCFGPKALCMALSALKVRGMSIYRIKNPEHPPVSAEKMEEEHRYLGLGNNIRAAIFGVNDGLVSNTSLLLGIAGASASNSMILLSGVSGLLAGAFSMAAGEYISVRSQREMLEYQLALEKCELELYPEEEAKELALIYEARGLPPAEAKRVANLLIKDPKNALNTLAREELGINPDDLVSPVGAALASFFSFAIGAFIPLIPFFIRKTQDNLIPMIFLTGISLFTVGALMSIFTQRSAIYSGLRMLSIGTMAGIITYCIGTLFTL